MANHITYRSWIISLTWTTPRTRRHKLVDIIAIAICATICGADSWVHVDLFGRSKLEWFQTFLELPGGIPSHDTFGDVFARGPRAVPELLHGLDPNRRTAAR